MRKAFRLVVLSLLALALPAAAQSAEVKKYLNAATALYENLEYEKALKQLAKAKAKASTSDDEARVGMMEGIVLADMGKEERALTAFKTAFGIDVEAKLPVEVSPKVQATADKARANVRKMLAPQFEAQRAEEAAKKAAEEKKRADEEAARLAAEQKRRDDEERARIQPPPAVTKPVESEGPSLRTLAWIPGGLGLVSAGVGTYFLVNASGKYTALMNGTAPQAEALAYRDGGKSSQLLGWVFTGVAVAGVAAAVTMFALGAPKQPVVTVAVTPGGAMVLVDLSGLLGGAP